MDWADPKIDAVFEDVWRILMEGLSVEKNAQKAERKHRSKP
jgi:hypothetical protein